MPVIRALSIVYIEIVRGVPLVTFLFMASVMFPLFVSPGVTVDKLLRAQLAFVIVIAAYVAEVVRAGLAGRSDGATRGGGQPRSALLARDHAHRLPQALRVSIPALVNTFIGFFKDTSLVAVIGLFDLLGAAKAVLTDAKWVGFGVEVYLFAAAIYFVFCCAISRYSQYLERALTGTKPPVISSRIERPDPCFTSRCRASNKWFGDLHVLRDINLTVTRGERIVICGPSGSGKSTLIRCINRLEQHQKGRIVVDGIELTNDLKKIDEVRRDVGMVFQQFNLFPHLTILENCTLAPIWVKKMPKREAEEVAMHYLGARQDPGAGRQVSRPALGRPAAARGDRPRRSA